MHTHTGNPMKEGIRIALEQLKSCDRHDLVWEWMEKSKRGEYVKFNELHSKLIKLLKSDEFLKEQRKK